MEKIYLDYASFTPVDPRVFDFAKPFLSTHFGNPSNLHSYGLEAKEAVENARQKVADLINASADDKIIFTSSATEANNLAIIGCAMRNKSKGMKLAASAIEHISVLNPMKSLAKQDFESNTIPVDKTGIVKMDALKKDLGKDAVVTSVMYANNEIGTIEPIKEISEIVHKKGLYLHVDATAAAGKIPVNVQKDGIDLLTLSSSDLYGPEGAGALFIRKGVKVQSVMLGGGQEQGLRSGTENVFAIAGMGEAARIVNEEMEEESKRLSRIRDRLIEEILKIDEAYLTGHPVKRLPHHASFRFSKIEGESILLNMDTAYGIQVSTGSACSSKTLEASHVLLAIGLKHEEAHGSMVITLGHSNNLKQVAAIVKSTKETVERLRKLSPL